MRRKRIRSIPKKWLTASPCAGVFLGRADLKARQTELDRTPYTIHQVVREVRDSVFPKIQTLPEVAFLNESTLAFILTDGALRDKMLPPYQCTKFEVSTVCAMNNESANMPSPKGVLRSAPLTTLVPL